MSTASRGRSLEHYIKKLLESDGWSCIRGAGSKGDIDLPGGVFKVDVTATKFGRTNKYILEIIAVQCKVKKISKRRKAWEEI